METNITPSAARNAVLQRFAALTPHEPVMLSPRFGCSMITQDGITELTVSYGGVRAAAKTFPEETLNWDIQRFSEEIAEPLALQLLNSRKPSEG